MNTAEDLKKEFATRFPKLVNVAEVYLGWDKSYTIKKAASNSVPFRIFKAVNTRNAPWIVDVKDLADWLEKQKAMAYKP